LKTPTNYPAINKEISDSFDPHSPDSWPAYAPWWARNAFKQFGYEVKDFEKGLNAFDMIEPSDRERAMANAQKVLHGYRVGINEYTAQRSDGSTFSVLLHSAPIIREATPVGLRGFIIDITEKKRLEMQLQQASRMEAIGTLAGGIAHDFNNLLMCIQGNVSLMLLNMASNHPYYDKLRSIEQYVQQGSDLTRQLLGFAQGGKYEVKPTGLNQGNGPGNGARACICIRHCTEP